MKSLDPTLRTVPLPLMAAALFATAAPLFAQSAITNPSFEANSFTVSPGDITDNAAITGWTGTPAAQVGLNSAAITTYANNGAIPNGANVAFLRAGATGPATLKGTATGLTIGTKYNVSFKANSTSGAVFNVPRLVFSTDGIGDPMMCDIAKVSSAVDATPWRDVAFEFTATATTQNLTLQNIRTTGDHTLLVDDFKIAPSNNEWSYHAWTGDADSGVDSQYVYTHAFNLGSTTTATINNVLFAAREFDSPKRVAHTGLGAVSNNQPLITGNSLGLAGVFAYNGSPSITLQNLKPNTQYRFSIYGVGFDAPTEGNNVPRAATFSSNLSTQKSTIDLSHYGRFNGIVVDYVYTTDALGSDVTISYPGVGADGTGAINTFHTCGFSNRETTPRTPAPTWTATQWTDDASTGLSGTYRYTHAINLNSTLTPNVNGVQFTALAAGGSTATYSSSIAGAVTDISNNVTGTSADLAKTFVYNAFPEYHKLSGLTPNTQYVVSIFSVGWDANGQVRPAIFRADPGDGGTLVDQSLFGNDGGIRWDHTYTAGADGTLVVTMTSLDGTTNIHNYAITNREAAPLANVAPTITSAPVGATLAVGDTYTLRVGISASPTLTYVWKRNSVVIPGATGPAYQINSASATDVGAYTVTVTNSAGSITTTAVNVDVRTLANGNFGTGLAADGSLLAGGAIDPHFIIFTNPDVAGSTAAYVETGNPGAWLQNTPTSQWIGPRVNTPPSAGGVYVYRTVIDLTGFTLSSVQITGSWSSDNEGQMIKVNDQTVAGTNNDTGNTFAILKPFTINPTNASTLVAGLNNIDFYVNNQTVGYTGLLVTGLKVVGTIPAGTAPHIVIPPASMTLAHFAQGILGVSANGSGTLSYQWYLNDVPISGATSSSYPVTLDSPAAGGAFKVKVTNSVGSVTTAAATVSAAPDSAPVVADLQYVTDKNVPLTIDEFDLIGAATDADPDVLRVKSIPATSVHGGTLSYSGPGGAVTYTPPTGYTGADSFAFSIDDGVWGGVGTGTVNITVNGTTTGGSTKPATQVAVVLSGGTATGSFTGVANATYTVQRSTDLVTWTNLPNVTASSTGAVQFSDATPPAGKAFYRVVYTP